MLVVVMGVTGVGKTTVGQLVAAKLGLPFYDADDFHPEANRRKMAAGIPLSERDRSPWLRELARRIPGWEAAGGAVLACSALRARHREILAEATSGEPVFVFLAAPPEVIRARLERRPGHYMPPSLLESQLAALEPPADDEALQVDADRPPERVAQSIVAALSRR